MYFPYLRGKQYELLALKELSPILGQAPVVTPIIEPVRVPTGSGLHRCLEALRENNLDFILIGNPRVGNLHGSGISQDILDFVNAADSESLWNIALLIDENTSADELISDYRNSFGTDRRLTLIHAGLSDQLTALKEATEDLARQYDIIDNRLRRQYFRNLLTTSSAVTLRDGFPYETRNSDYLGREETMFSDEHLFYRDEGWHGFSDYLTIGQQYADGGFTPRAVAIHWTYEPFEGSPIMVRHFTSESNGDTANVGGKFLEAAAKLVAFVDEHDIHTQASEVFRDHVANGTYPGLGIVKKLSIQNHLEMMSGILGRS